MKRNDWLLGILLLIATATAYVPAYRGAFIWDDDAHVHENAQLRSLEGLGNIWFRIGATPQYYPLTHTTFWLEWQAWGNEPVWYHITNVALHIIASLLVVRLLRQYALPGAWLAGFVFALHPLHVESVAWISERKNTLSIVFALLALIAYPPHQRWSKDDWKRWSLASALYLCAVLSKTITCTLPAVLLVVAWWNNGRLTRQDLLRLAPWLVVSVLAAVVTGGMERTVVGAQGEDWSLTWVERILVAGRAVWWYATKVVWPGELAFSYERWVVDPWGAVWWLLLGCAVLVVGCVLASSNRLGRGLAAAVLIFVGTLFPALGFFNLYPHRYSFVADHFQYHSNIALIAAICCGLAVLARRVPRWLGACWATLLVMMLAWLSFEQSGIYRDPETLWRDTIAKTPTSWLAHHNLGQHLTNASDDPAVLEEAVALLERTRELRPAHEYVDWSQAVVLRKLNRIDEAERYFERAEARYRVDVDADPKSQNARYLLVQLLDARGRPTDAMQAAREASDALPEVAWFAEQAATRLMNAKQNADAIPYLRRWANLRPRAIEPRMRLAFCLESQGDLIEARSVVLEAIRIDPMDERPKRAMEHLSKRLTPSP